MLKKLLCTRKSGCWISRERASEKLMWRPRTGEERTLSGDARSSHCRQPIASSPSQAQCRSLFPRLVLAWILTDFGDQILIFQYCDHYFSRSPKQSTSSWISLFFDMLQKFCEILRKFSKIFQNPENSPRFCKTYECFQILRNFAELNQIVL